MLYSKEGQLPILKAATKAPTNIRKMVPGPRMVPAINIVWNKRVPLLFFITTNHYKSIAEQRTFLILFTFVWHQCITAAKVVILPIHLVFSPYWRLWQYLGCHCLSVASFTQMIHDACLFSISTFQSIFPPHSLFVYLLDLFFISFVRNQTSVLVVLYFLFFSFFFLRERKFCNVFFFFIAPAPELCMHVTVKYKNPKDCNKGYHN